MSELQAWVDKLGGMPADDIHRLIKENGIKGLPCESRRCPIAKFLTREIGTAVTVGYSFINMTIATYKETYQTPRSVEEFIGRFDSGWYPDMIDHRPLAPYYE